MVSGGAKRHIRHPTLYFSPSADHGNLSSKVSHGLYHAVGEPRDGLDLAGLEARKYNPRETIIGQTRGLWIQCYYLNAVTVVLVLKSSYPIADRADLY